MRVRKEELAIGKIVELEHTDNEDVATKIATDHLKENPKYYSKLIRAGLIDEKNALKYYEEHKDYFDNSLKESKMKILIKKSVLVEMGIIKEQTPRKDANRKEKEEIEKLKSKMSSADLKKWNETQADLKAIKTGDYDEFTHNEIKRQAKEELDALKKKYKFDHLIKPFRKVYSSSIW